MTNLVDLLTLENLTLLIALWGAALSTYKVISDRSKSVRKLKVSVSYGFISQGNSVSPTTIMISAVNEGFRDITLNSMGFLLPNNNKTVMLEPQSNVTFPYTLSEGKSCVVWKLQKQFAIELRKNGYIGAIKVKGYFQDATGKIMSSKSIVFNTEKVLLD
jgi:hypothetical protein